MADYINFVFKEIHDIPCEFDFSISMLSVVIDCKNANTLADFYASLLGWQKNTDDPEWILVSKAGITPCLLFQEEVDYKPPVWPDNPNEQQKNIHSAYAKGNSSK